MEKDIDYREIKPKPDLFERKGVRWTLFGLIPALVFVLLCAGIRVSQYGIDHTILVYGDDILVSGRPAALRISLMADDGRFFLPEELTGFLIRGSERHLLFGGAVSDRGQALGKDFRVPKLERGKYELELDIRFNRKRRKVRAPVTVVDTPPPESLNVPSDTQLETPIPSVKKGGIEIQSLTEDRGAPTGITSVLFFRAVDEEGAPVSTDIEMTLPGREERVEERTDRLGLAGIAVRPLELAVPVQIHGSKSDGEAPPAPAAPAGDAPTEPSADGGLSEVETGGAYLRPNVVYSGLAATVESPLASLGEPVSVTVEQVSTGGPLYADLFYQGRLVKAASGWVSGRSAAINVKPELPGLYRLQLSTTPFSADKGVAVRHFYVLKKDETPVQGLRAILGRLETSERDGAWAKAVSAMPLERAAGFKPALAAAFALSRLYRGHRPLANLVSSRREDDRELNEFKAGFQRMVMLAIIALGAGVSLLIAFSAYTTHKRQQLMSEMILSGRDETDDEEMRRSVRDRGGTARLAVQGVIIVFIVLGAFVAIALLIDTLSWRS